MVVDPESHPAGAGDAREGIKAVLGAARPQGPGASVLLMLGRVGHESQACVGGMGTHLGVPVRFPASGDGAPGGRHPVHVRLTADLLSGQAAEGARVDLEVSRAVTQHGAVVIPEGSVVWGAIQIAKPGKTCILISRVCGFPTSRP